MVEFLANLVSRICLNFLIAAYTFKHSAPLKRLSHVNQLKLTLQKESKHDRSPSQMSPT